VARQTVYHLIQRLYAHQVFSGDREHWQTARPSEWTEVFRQQIPTDSIGALIAKHRTVLYKMQSAVANHNHDVLAPGDQAALAEATVSLADAADDLGVQV
jgi:hypothetical protein